MIYKDIRECVISDMIYGIREYMIYCIRGYMIYEGIMEYIYDLRY